MIAEKIRKNMSEAKLAGRNTEAHLLHAILGSFFYNKAESDSECIVVLKDMISEKTAEAEDIDKKMADLAFEKAGSAIDLKKYHKFASERHALIQEISIIDDYIPCYSTKLEVKEVVYSIVAKIRSAKTKAIAIGEAMQHVNCVGIHALPRDVVETVGELRL